MNTEQQQLLLGLIELQQQDCWTSFINSGSGPVIQISSHIFKSHSDGAAMYVQVVWRDGKVIVTDCGDTLSHYMDEVLDFNHETEQTEFQFRIGEHSDDSWFRMQARHVNATISEHNDGEIMVKMHDPTPKNVMYAVRQMFRLMSMFDSIFYFDRTS